MPLSKDESAKLDEIHENVAVAMERLKAHDIVLFGRDRNTGLTREVTLLAERQKNCPALKLAGRDNRMFYLGLVSIAISMLALVLAFTIHSAAFGELAIEPPPETVPGRP